MDYTQAKINEFTQFIKDCFKNNHKMCESERFAYFLIRVGHCHRGKAGDVTRTIYLPAIDKTVSLGQYIKAVKKAKQHPSYEFKHGLTTWWPTTGEEIMRQFIRGMNERINQAIPYNRRGMNIQS